MRRLILLLRDLSEFRGSRTAALKLVCAVAHRQVIIVREETHGQTDIHQRPVTQLHPRR